MKFLGCARHLTLVYFSFIFDLFILSLPPPGLILFFLIRWGCNSSWYRRTLCVRASCGIFLFGSRAHHPHWVLWYACSLSYKWYHLFFPPLFLDPLFWIPPSSPPIFLFLNIFTEKLLKMTMDKLLPENRNTLYRLLSHISDVANCSKFNYISLGHVIRIILTFPLFKFK